MQVNNFPNRPRNQTVCPECRGTVQADGVELSCTDCGLIVATHDIDHGPDWRHFPDDETDPARCYPSNSNRPDGGLGSNPPKFTTSGPERQPEVAHRNEVAQRRSSSTKDRNRGYTTTEIDRLGSALEVPDSVTDQAKQAFRSAHKTTSLTGHDLDRLAAAALLYAARAQRIGLTAEQLTTAAYIDNPQQIRIKMHDFADTLDVAVRPPSPVAQLPRIAQNSELAVTPRLVSDAQAYLTQAGPPSGRSPSALVAATLYIAGGATLSQHGNWTCGHWSQAEVATAADVSEITVSRTAKALYDHAGSI